MVVAVIRATVFLCEARSFGLFLLFYGTVPIVRSEMIRQYMPRQLVASGHSSLVHPVVVVSM